MLKREVVNPAERKSLGRPWVSAEICFFHILMKIELAPTQTM